MTYAVSPGRHFRRAALVFALAATLVPLCLRMGPAGETARKAEQKGDRRLKVQKTSSSRRRQKLSLVPSKFEFSNPRGTLQLVATGTYAHDRIRDLTADVKLTSSDPKVARIKGTTVIPVGDGTARITAKIGDREATAEVVVRGVAMRLPQSASRTKPCRPSPRRAATWGPVTALRPARTAFDCRCGASIRRSTSSRCGPSTTAAART